MIKALTKDNILTVPFTITKKWTVQSEFPQDFILYQSGSFTCPITYTSMDYNNGNYPATEVSQSNIALSPQPDEIFNIQEGCYVDNSIPFNPTVDVKNPGEFGTYKRLTYNTIYNTFYNTFNNPLEILGLNNIDFELDGCKRTISDEFISFTVPQIFLGEDIKTNSISIKTFLLDQSFIINDDGNGNLVSTTPIFTTYQKSRNFN